MVSRDEIKKDPRFSIDDWNLERITHRPIVSYEIANIKLGDIWRLANGKPVPLSETDVYKYLDGSKKSRDVYQAYCDSPLCEGNDNRSVEVYDSLIQKFSQNPYDMKVGAIFVDQLNFILEGQHRSCILLHNFGPDHKIDVVKINYKGLYIRTRIKKMFEWLKRQGK